HRDTNNRRRIGVEFLDDWLFGSQREVVQDQIDLVSDFLRGDVGVLLEQERDEDLRHAFNRRRTQLVDTGDGVDGAFDFVRDLSLDLLRRRAGIHDRNRDRRQVDLRKEVHAERLVREQPDDGETQDEHRRKNRTANAYL